MQVAVYADKVMFIEKLAFISKIPIEVPPHVLLFDIASGLQALMQERKQYLMGSIAAAM